jgi:hypothetical protein
LLAVTALAGALLLHSCSQESPDDTPAAALPPASTKRTPGTAADSLNGIAGHTFGEPLSNFPGLILVEKHDEVGVRLYRMPAGRERGWFGKYAQYLITTYKFQDGRFSMFEAITTGPRPSPSPTDLREEALSLFGPGKKLHNLMGEIVWDGERVRALFSEKRDPPLMSWLQVYSKPLRAVQQAKQKAPFQADSAAGGL